MRGVRVVRASGRRQPPSVADTGRGAAGRAGRTEKGPPDEEKPVPLGAFSSAGAVLSFPWCGWRGGGAVGYVYPHWPRGLWACRLGLGLVSICLNKETQGALESKN